MTTATTPTADPSRTALATFLDEEREDGHPVRPELVERLAGITSPHMDVRTMRTLHDSLVSEEGHAPERRALLEQLLEEHGLDAARAGWLRYSFLVRQGRGVLPELTREAFIARLEELRAASTESEMIACVRRWAGCPRMPSFRELGA